MKPEPSKEEKEEWERDEKRKWDKKVINDARSAMWSLRMAFGQDIKANIPTLEKSVYDLLQMVTQKTAGQRDHVSKSTGLKDLDWETLETTMMSIVCEATCLVLSGRLDGMKSIPLPPKKEKEKENEKIVAKKEEPSRRPVPKRSPPKEETST